MYRLKKIFSNARLKVNKIGSSKRNKNLKYKDITIISNNCYSGIIYQYLGIRYNSPTIGLYFFANEYIRFLKNFNYYINCELKFIDSKKSKYFAELVKVNNEDAIIGILDDVEIVFLHYKTTNEAYEKWNKRCKRINKNNIIFKFNDQNLCTDKHIVEFDNLKLTNKICFTSKEYKNLESVIWLKKYKNNSCVKNDYYASHKYFNILNYINNIKENKDDFNNFTSI